MLGDVGGILGGSLPDHHHTIGVLGDFGKDLMLPNPKNWCCPNHTRPPQEPSIISISWASRRITRGEMLVGTEDQEECPEPSAIAKNIKGVTPSSAKKHKKGDWGRRLRVTLFMFLAVEEGSAQPS